MGRKRKSDAEIAAEARAFETEELPRLVRELKESEQEAKKKWHAAIEARKASIRSDEKLLTVMATAEVKAVKWFADRGCTLDTMRDFLRENPDAIAAPTFLKIILSLSRLLKRCHFSGKSPSRRIERAPRGRRLGRVRVSIARFRRPIRSGGASGGAVP